MTGRPLRGTGHGEVAGDVEVRITVVVDEPVLLAQPQPLDEEQEVEPGPFGRLCEVDERVELDVAARPRVAPHRRVVDAREVRREVDLLGHGQPFTASRTGWSVGTG